MNTTLKALGALLTYPDEVLIKALPEIFTALETDTTIKAEHRPRLKAFQDYLAGTDPWVLQESYVERFDTGRSTSLHLFEHVHGESKDRGQAMVDLKEHYEAAGLNLAPSELPDFLPAFLEFLSLQTPEITGDFLGNCAHVLEALRDRLMEKSSPYAAVFPVLLNLAGNPSQESIPQINPQKTLDEEWAEEPAFSGSSCSGVQ